MQIKDFLCREGELPLDRIAEDGGFTAIFKKIACVGDSLASGEFEVKNEEGQTLWIDRREHSWGQYIARMCGSTVYNFSKGGMNAKEYRRAFANNSGFWQRDLAANAYIIALGVNDILNSPDPNYGDFSDICHEDYEKNEWTFIGNYAYIIQRYKSIQPDAKFFLVGMPRSGRDDERVRRHRDILIKLAEIFSNTYFLDLYQYAPELDAEFKRNFYLGSHLTPTGYYFMAKVIASYIDYIIRKDMPSFKYVGLMGFDFKNPLLS